MSHHQNPPVTPGVIEQVLAHILPRLPYLARRHARRPLGYARDPQRCVLRTCLLSFLDEAYDCSGLLGVYPDEIWVQGAQRPLRVIPPAWATALEHGLDQQRQVGEQITGGDLLAQLQRQGLLVLHAGSLWGQGALAPALLLEEGTPDQDRVYRGGRGSGPHALSWIL
jgi:hypothetical protein